MDRTEFIDRLQRSLAGGVNSSQVADNVRYYQDYIDTEIRKGRSETDVLFSLGDPRLLAKSIIEANKRAGYIEGTNRNFDEERQEDSEQERKQAVGVVRVPSWLIILIVIVIALLIIGVVFSVISFLAPIIIPVLLVMLIYHYFLSK